MHHYSPPAHVKDRVLRRMGKLVADEEIDARRAALVVIDMQNYFCAEGFPAEVPMARRIVPNINRAAYAMRAAGGHVVWVQTTSRGACEQWRNYQTRMLSSERQRERLDGLDEASEGFRLFPTLAALPDDLYVRKIKYSAFIPGSSDIDACLRSREVDTVLIAGTLTNVCCEASARDAMMLDYKAVMLSDGNATQTDDEHAAALNTFFMYFGDVMTTGEVITRLTATPGSASALLKLDSA